VDRKGNLLRLPGEVTQGMTLEQVYDAHAVMDMMEDLQAEMSKPKGK
jgi:hypothetical protein